MTKEGEVGFQGGGWPGTRCAPSWRGCVGRYQRRGANCVKAPCTRERERREKREEEGGGIEKLEEKEGGMALMEKGEREEECACREREEEEKRNRGDRKDGLHGNAKGASPTFCTEQDLRLVSDKDFSIPRVNLESNSRHRVEFGCL